jgi:hypothetical protein
VSFYRGRRERTLVPFRRDERPCFGGRRSRTSQRLLIFPRETRLVRLTSRGKRMMAPAAVMTFPLSGPILSLMQPANSMTRFAAHRNEVLVQKEAATGAMRDQVMADAQENAAKARAGRRPKKHCLLVGVRSLPIIRDIIAQSPLWRVKRHFAERRPSFRVAHAPGVSLTLRRQT